MSRSRSRTSTSTVDIHKLKHVDYHQIYFNYSTHTDSSEDINGASYVKRVDAITDDSNPRHTPNPNRFRPWLSRVHECDHQKTSINYPPGDYRLGAYYVESGWEERNTSITYGSALEYAIWELPGFNPVAYPLLGLSHNGTSESYASVDWYALKDAFYEAVDGLIPQAFFFGEDAVENDIFIDAFKILLNPSRAVRTATKLFKQAVGFGRGFKYTTLGNARAAVKGLANGHLLYQFAIRPAIDDIRSALNAHQAIEKRLRFIEDHRGSFIPIKVRRKFKSSYVNFDRPPRIPALPTAWAEMTGKEVVASISAWGKVRSDITVQPRWAAYTEYFGLNKIVGTAWELIPFSFVIDWLTNAQEHINSMTRLRTSSPYTEIVNQIYSVKEQTKYRMYIQAPSILGISSVTSPTSPVTIADVRTSHYKRTYNCPGIPRLIAPSSLGLSKAASLGSVIIQKL